MTPAALRAMRGALGWSMRALAQAAGIALATVLSAEKGNPIAPATARRIRSAFRAQGVSLTIRGATSSVRIGPPPSSVRSTLGLSEIPFVTIRPRKDGTARVFFEVPARLRPEGWPGTRPLPFSVPRRGRLDDPREIAAIKADAARLKERLDAARARTPQMGREA